MSKLYIIGNGFDISHGVPSRYSDFLMYVNLYHHNEFTRIGQMFGTGNPSFLWQDFENNLGTFDINRSIRLNLSRFIQIARHNRKRNLTDFTALENAYDGLFNTIQFLFRDWFHDTIIGKNPELKYRAFTNEDFFINFNYTNVLECVYGIDNRNICYIHNNLFQDEITMPIFGHGLTDESIVRLLSISRESKQYIDENGVSFDDVNEIYRTLLYDFRKNTEGVLSSQHVQSFFQMIGDKSIDDLIILGHSLGECDKPYFCKISEIIGNTPKIKVSYYTPYEKEKLYDFVREVFPNSEIELLTMNEILG